MSAHAFYDSDFEDGWIAEAESRNQRVSDLAREYVSNYARGDRKFWGYMHESVYESVRAAFTAIGMAPADRWKLVELAVWKEINAEAQAIAEDVVR
jgi:hypothetical protein